ncbi:MAG: glucoamylase [Clostridiales bacterium]|jgi:oligosaccharide amylase|nr:glucoamylase [Clostridiales bacterium]
MKTYFNDAVVGNSRVLGCINRKGELVRLFWPHIDYPQHIESFQMAIYVHGNSYSTIWLQNDEWDRKQQYISDTNILKTIYKNEEIGFRIVCTDFVIPEEDTLVRSIEIENISGQEKNINFLTFSNFISNTTDVRSTLFDFEQECIVHYRHNYYFAVAGSSRVVDFQITNDAYNAAVRSEFYGVDDIGMTGEAVQAWELGKFYPNDKKVINIYVCCAHTLAESLEKTRKVKNQNVDILIEHTKKYWLDYLDRRKKVHTESNALDELYRRSLLIFKLMSDEMSGGLLAAPEIDEHFTRCGRYAYCWGRDAAFITSALDRAGYTELVDKFYQWSISAQAKNGSWYQRYFLDGNLAPSWGLQIDETGTLLWGMLQHYNVIKEKTFLEKVWPSVKKGGDFLSGFIDEKNNLPKATYDLWEERIGQHTYSCAAVYAGLIAAVKINDVLNKQDINAEKWKEVAINIKKSMEEKLWDEQGNRFYRGINSSVNGWGFEGHGGKKEIVVNPKGYKRWVSALDIMVDISLLGVAIPFGVFECQDDRVKNTARAIEEKLTSPTVGGIRRYETDGYMGGNPWILTTLWMALYHIQLSHYDKAKEYLWWTANHKTSLGLLPEQVHKDTGEPAWVIPLTWSHAMYVLVYLELAEKGKL